MVMSIGRRLALLLATVATTLVVVSGAALGAPYYVGGNYDQIDPTVGITTPADNATYGLGEQIKASYICKDNAKVKDCIGTVPNGSYIDTKTVGCKSFTVTARDYNNNSTTATNYYSVNSRDSSVNQCATAA